MQYALLIDGEWTSASDEATYGVMNPTTEEVLAEVPEASTEDVRAAIDAARQAFDSGPWPRTPPKERGAIIERLGDLVEAHAEELAALESANGGKPIRQATIADLPMAIEHTRHFGRLAGTLEDELVDLPDLGMTGRVAREPVGVCAGIIPWNYPLLMAVWKVAPALAAGNTIVLKPATYTPLTGLEYARLAQEAGVPDGVLNVVLGPGPRVGEELVASPKVDRVAFTGSTKVGSQIMTRGAATVKKVTLELGGKAPMLVLEGADLDEALRGTLFGAFLHQGQVCLSGTRLLLPQSLHDQFMDRIVEMARRMRVGPTDSWETDMGPLISASQRERVEAYIAQGAQEGAHLVVGGSRPKHLPKGFFLEPTIFDGVSNDMTIAQEEIFGPVLSVMTYEGLDEAVELANGTEYGLAASVWSGDLDLAEKVSREIRAGTVWINHHHILSCAAPHGGYKQSGVGRELGIYGLHEYTQLKHIFLDESGEVMKEAFGLVLPE